MKIEQNRIINIPKGSINKIISHLKEKNCDMNKLDSIFLRFMGTPKNGYIRIKEKSISKANFLYKITQAKAEVVNVTLIPGETTYIFFKQLAKKLNLDITKLRKEFKKQSPIEEGAFLADTYNVFKKTNEKRVIKSLLTRSLKRMKKISFKIFNSYDEKRWFKYITIASVIQKESANNKEMPIVSSVIYNRLKKGMRLQMDGTLNYGKYSHIKVTSKRIREDRSRFNTYKIKGLPAIPVCNVSFNAIKSAIYPVKTDYLYFMKNKKGVHDFSRNYSTHLKNINATK